MHVYYVYLAVFVYHETMVDHAPPWAGGESPFLICICLADVFKLILQLKLGSNGTIAGY